MYGQLNNPASYMPFLAPHAESNKHPPCWLPSLRCSSFEAPSAADSAAGVAMGPIVDAATRDCCTTMCGCAKLANCAVCQQSKQLGHHNAGERQRTTELQLTSPTSIQSIKRAIIASSDNCRHMYPRAASKQAGRAPARLHNSRHEVTQ